MVLKLSCCFFVLLCVVPTSAEQTEVDLLIRSWNKHPDSTTLSPLLDKLYFPFLTDGTSKPLHSFYQSIRQKEVVTDIVSRFKQDFITKYSFDESYSNETAALWMMPPLDARRLFLIIQIERESIPDEILRAMFKSIYLDVERCFGFEFAFRGRFGVFPASEYQRLLAIMVRISGHEDFFLKSWNLYCQGVIYLNLGDTLKGRQCLSVSRDYLKKALVLAETQLARKMIWLRLAQADQLLGNFEAAQIAYVEVLRMDPQDWHALSGLSAILQKLNQCNQPGIWIEATARSNQQLYDIIVHCGTQEWTPENRNDEAPAIASLRSLFRRLPLCC